MTKTKTKKQAFWRSTYRAKLFTKVKIFCFEPFPEEHQKNDKIKNCKSKWKQKQNFKSKQFHPAGCVENVTAWKYTKLKLQERRFPPS